MAEASMLLLTVMAAGIAAVSTGVVIVRSDVKQRSTWLPSSSGNTVSVLCLCSSESKDVFRKVVESELDDTAQAADRPGYRLVFRTVDQDNGHRFESAYTEVRDSDHRMVAGTMQPYAGVVVDAVGFKAFVDRANPDCIPDFMVAVSPAPSHDPARDPAPTPAPTSVPVTGGAEPAAAPACSAIHWTCDNPAKAATTSMPTLSKCKTELEKVPRSVVLQGMETDCARLESTNKVTVKKVPNRKFLVFDVERVCPSKTGGAMAPLTPEQIALRKEREKMEGEKKAEKNQYIQYAKELTQVNATRGQRLCGGLLKAAVDMCVSETALTPHPQKAFADKGDARAADLYEKWIKP